MTYKIIFSSNTGNTEMLGKAIKDALNENDCIYYGKVNGASNQDAEMLFIGFWVFLGTCTEEMKKYLATLENKKIFLFGTAGFGGSKSYFETILTSVKENISASNEIIGSFMCQGKMQHNVLERYQKLLVEQPENINVPKMITNYELALPHPDLRDLDMLKGLVSTIPNNDF